MFQISFRAVGTTLLASAKKILFLGARVSWKNLALKNIIQSQAALGAEWAPDGDPCFTFCWFCALAP